MKRNLLYLLMLVGIMSVFTACDDDKDEPNIPIEKELAGTYKGNLDIVMNGAPLANGLPKNISISKAGVSSINLELKDFSFMGQNLGDIIISDCKMLKYRDHYTFSGNQALTLPAPIGECKVVADGTLIGNDITVDLEIAVAALQQTVKVTFAGAKLSGSESSEAEITSFTFESDFVTAQPVIDQTTNRISFVVSDLATSDDLKELVPVIAVSKKATLLPGSGIKQDFNNNVKYTVVAENGLTREYIVSIDAKSTLYTFEDWSFNDTSDPKFQFPIIGSNPESPEWATCNSAVMLIKALGGLAGITYDGEWPIKSTTISHSGEKALEMVSVDTKGGDMFGTKVPKVTAGSAFLGVFEAGNAMVDPMTTTAFGIPYTKQPLKVTGFFSYSPGTEFYDADGNLVPEGKDACALSAVLYEVGSYDETLDGNNIYDSPKIVAQAMYTYDKKTNGYMPFELNLTYSKDYNSANKKYKFAVIFAASKDGAAYRAAVGSRLLIDDVTILNK